MFVRPRSPRCRARSVFSPNTTAIVDTMAQNKLAQAAGGDLRFPSSASPKLPEVAAGSSTSGTPFHRRRPAATAKLAPREAYPSAPGWPSASARQVSCCAR
jgi:hypothetical protein